MFKLSAKGVVVLTTALVLTLMTVTPVAAAPVEPSEVPENNDSHIAAVSVSEAEIDFDEYISSLDCLTPQMLEEYREYLLTTLKVETVSYVVEPGDTLTAIAARFDVSVNTISASNDIKNPDRIYPGQELEFPAVDGVLYTAEEAVNLSEVAEKYDVSARDIFYAMGGLEGDEVEAGTRLIVPGAKIPDPVVTRSTASRSGMASYSGPSLMWPVKGTITSVFGSRGGTHLGLDIAQSPGTPIRAAAAGTVEYSGWSGSYGRLVLVRHNEHVVTAYAHASQLKVAKGDWVDRGDVIATVGATGNATGPHLHFEVRIDGVKYDPLPLLTR
ncbi:MAG: M23 family metallopeptidase [Firmicutes bacterium]|nr:M23 family metallopeptidase [Bacillota bacterium]